MSEIYDSKSNHRRIEKRIHFGFPVLLLLVSCWAWGCEKEKPAAAGPPEVEVFDVVQKDVPITREWVATLSGFVNADIRAQVSGYLLKQTYVNGDFVRKGTKLFELDPRTFQAALDQATGNLKQAHADLARAEAQLGKTQMDVDRYRPLVAQKALSQQELDNAIQANLGAKAQVEGAKAAIETSKAAVESAKLNLGFSSITAPIDGVAGIANAQVGDLVGPQSTNPLTTISTVDPILVNFTASEEEYLRSAADIERVKMTTAQGLRALTFNLELADGSTFPYKGTFYALDRQVDIRTGTILVQVKVPNPQKTLRPGGFGKVNTVVMIRKNALLIPQRAVTNVQGQYLVAVVDRENKVNIRKVVAGSRIGSMWIITEGLKPGDRVVAEGTQKVREGAVVIPKPYQGEAATAENANKGAAN